MRRGMEGGGIHAFELVFLLLLVMVVVFAVLARKLQTPYPIVLVIAGLFLSFIPGIPKITLNPDVIFLVVLPPLLYNAAWLTPWREFRFNLVSICLLAFGLVGFTVAGVAATATWVFAGFDWRLGFVLGAVVATTDAIAATSIAKRVGLPQGIVDILEGESLLNDATGLLALEFGVAIVVTGETPTLGGGLLRLGYLTIAGVVLGLVIGVIVEAIHKSIDDGPIEITLSIIVPYAAYLGAEAIHSSGVLAVVACGLYMSRHSSHFFSPSVRIQAWAVWDSLTFVLNGLVFVLIGLQLPFVLAGIREYSFRQLLQYGALFSGILILLRLIWMYPGAYLANFIRRRVLHQNPPFPSARGIFVVGWTGMRGVIALAAALSLPETLSDGSAFPQRNLIIFLTFCVILVTLVLQGLTLPPLIRALGLAGAAGHKDEEEAARRAMIEAALAHLEIARLKDGGEFATVYNEIEQRYKHRLANLIGQDDQGVAANRDAYARNLELSRSLLGTERQTALKLREAGRINDEVLRKVEHELDLTETRLSLMS
ncbi:MAG: Na+/H+ antiporter [Candidatus Acidiferrum sp.]